jgi:hypothetical protein
MDSFVKEHWKWIVAFIVGVAIGLLSGCSTAQAQTPSDWPDDLKGWTEGSVIMFDQVDGNFEPRLTGRFLVYVEDKGLGWFFAENDATGPVLNWKAWWVRTGALRHSLILLGSTDLSDAQEEGMWNDALLGIEYALYWDRMKNLELRAGILNARFVEGEAARITPYLGLSFRL